MSLLRMYEEKDRVLSTTPPDRQTGSGAAAVIAIKPHVLNIPL